MDELTTEEVKETLATHYGEPADTNRELHVVKHEDSHGSTGSVLLSLDGSPPKGYALYIPELHEVSLYDLRGERFQHHRDTIIADIDG